MVSPAREEREYKRIKHPFTARFRIYQEERSKESCRWDIVTIRNLSANGISFNYSKKIALDTVLEFNIMLPFTIKSVHCLGVVRRIDENPPERADLKKIPVYGIAVRFTEIEDDKKEAINEFVKEFHFEEDGKIEK